jgi:hypothetical protein
MTIEDKKAIKEIVNTFFESVSKKDIEKLQSLCSGTS